MHKARKQLVFPTPPLFDALIQREAVTVSVTDRWTNVSSKVLMLIPANFGLCSHFLPSPAAVLQLNADGQMAENDMGCFDMVVFPLEVRRYAWEFGAMLFGGTRLNNASLC